MRRPPRVFYWSIGAAIALAGALAARTIAEALPEYRIPIWFVGSGLIFAGLYVLSLGTKARLDVDPGEDDADPPR
jgi:hypothetical protein